LLVETKCGKKEKIEIGEVDAKLTQVAKQNPDETYITEVNFAIKVEGHITEEQKEILIKEANNYYATCLVKRDWIILTSQQV